MHQFVHAHPLSRLSLSQTEKLFVVVEVGNLTSRIIQYKVHQGGVHFYGVIENLGKTNLNKNSGYVFQPGARKETETHPPCSNSQYLRKQMTWLAKLLLRATDLTRKRGLKVYRLQSCGWYYRFFLITNRLTYTHCSRKLQSSEPYYCFPLFKHADIDTFQQ